MLEILFCGGEQCIGISSQKPPLTLDGFALVTELRFLFYFHSHPAGVPELGKEDHNQGQKKYWQQMGPSTKDSETSCSLGSPAASLVLGPSTGPPQSPGSATNSLY